MFKKSLALTGLLVSSLAANAALVDFTIPGSGYTVISYADVSGYNAASAISGGNIVSETGFDSILLGVTGENLRISINDVASGNPYFDADSGGPGGLGSCRSFEAGSGLANCNPSSDDNLTIAENESLRLDFSNNSSAAQQTAFGEFLFYDDNHNAITGTIRVTHDGGMDTISVAGGIGDLSVIGSSSFLLFNDQADATKASTNYYITQATVSNVPIPAAIWLFGSALLGLAGLRRKQS